MGHSCRCNAPPPGRAAGTHCRLPRPGSEVSWARGPSEPGVTAWASSGPALGFPSPCASGTDSRSGLFPKQHRLHMRGHRLPLLFLWDVIPEEFPSSRQTPSIRAPVASAPRHTRERGFMSRVPSKHKPCWLSFRGMLYRFLFWVKNAVLHETGQFEETCEVGNVGDVSGKWM